MVAVPFRLLAHCERSQLGAAHQHVRLARSRIEIHQLTAIEISQMLAIGRPGKFAGRGADRRSMRKDLLDSEGLWRSRLRLRRSLCGELERGGRQSRKRENTGQKQADRCTG